MLFVMNMVIMNHVHHLSAEIEGKKPIRMPESMPKILTELPLHSYYRLSNIPVKIIQFFSCGQKCDSHNIVEIAKEAVGFPVICHLLTREFTSGGSTLFFYHMHCSAV